MNVLSKQFNMPPEVVLAEAPPVFTECVSNDEPRSPQSGDMAKRLQQLLEQIQSHPNPAARALLQECVQSLLAFYGEGLARILGHIQDAGTGRDEILARLLQDQAVSGLLLIHGLHPVPLETP